jgi:hypothetical protein
MFYSRLSTVAVAVAVAVAGRRSPVAGRRRFSQ